VGAHAGGWQIPPVQTVDAQSPPVPQTLPFGQVGEHAGGGPPSEASADPSAGASTALESCAASACEESARASLPLESAAASGSASPPLESPIVPSPWAEASGPAGSET
jgi:hypothetical protein